jgi:hypothetical protein
MIARTIDTGIYPQYTKGMKPERKLLLNLFEHDQANIDLIMEKWRLPTMASAIRFALEMIAQRGEHPSNPLAGEIRQHVAGGASDSRRQPSDPAQTEADCAERTSGMGARRAGR